MIAAVRHRRAVLDAVPDLARPRRVRPPRRSAGRRRAGEFAQVETLGAKYLAMAGAVPTSLGEMDDVRAVIVRGGLGLLEEAVAIVARRFRGGVPLLARGRRTTSGRTARRGVGAAADRQRSARRCAGDGTIGVVAGASTSSIPRRTRRGRRCRTRPGRRRNASGHGAADPNFPYRNRIIAGFGLARWSSKQRRGPVR